MAKRDLYGRPPAALSPSAHRVSRRALLRGQIARWTGAEAPVVERPHAATARVRAGWQREGHEAWLRAIEPIGRALVELAGVEEHTHVLDVGAGDGNVALAAKQAGGRVTACDLAPAMVERGRARCPGAAWSVADVQDLPFPDGTFGATVSAFGAALAPRPGVAARELVRVTRPGGVVALAAWIPRGLPGGLDAWVEQETAWPEGVPLPSAWGERSTAEARLGTLLEELELRTATVALRFPSAEDLFAALALPLRLDEHAADALRPRFDALLDSCNNALDSVEVDARYLLVRGRRPIPQG